VHLRTQASCEDLQMIKMRACCTWKRQDQSVAEVANETAKPKRSGLERPIGLEANAAFVTATDLLIDGGYIPSKVGSQPTAVPR
jgi:hypothetical protein